MSSVRSSWVAIDDRDKIVGYLIMSDIIHPPENAFCKERVIWARSGLCSSFFADSAPIARSLLKVAVRFASANKPRHNIFIHAPVVFNPEFVTILQSEIGAKPIQEATVMSRKELPTQHLRVLLILKFCELTLTIRYHCFLNHAL